MSVYQSILDFIFFYSIHGVRNITILGVPILFLLELYILVESSVDNINSLGIDHVGCLSRFSYNLDERKSDDSAIYNLFALSGML